MKELIGTIKQDTGEAVFVGNGTRFVFVPTDECGAYASDGVDAGRGRHGCLKPVDGFLRCRTVDNRDLLVCCDEEIGLAMGGALNSWLHILAKHETPLESFDAIEFEGGSIESVFVRNSMDVKHGGRSDSRIELVDDKITVPLGDDTTMEIFSNARERRTCNGGVFLETGPAMLRLRFDGSPRCIDGKFESLYTGVREMISFLTFCKTVWFEEVRLKKKVVFESGGIGYVDVAECHIDDGGAREVPRDSVRCLTLNALGKNPIAKLYGLIQGGTSKKCRFSAKFEPETRADFSWLKPMQLRDVCTALELEAELSGVKVCGMDALAAQIDLSKERIKAIDDDVLDGELKNYACSSLSRIKAPAALLASVLYESRKGTLRSLLQSLDIDDIGADRIREIIKIRNNLTHSGEMHLDGRIAETCLVLMAVVYSSILGRCGVEDDVIDSMFGWGFFTSY